MNNGWFRINRKIFENPIWFSEPFTKAQAWIDVVGNANHKDGFFFIRGNEVKVKRGQLGWSEVTMAKRWTWSRNKVRRFLNWLEMEQQIEQQKLFKLTTIITIINYDKYQNDTTNDTTEGQQKDNRRYTNKNVKNDKEVIKKGTHTKLSDLSDKDFNEIAIKYDCPIAFVRSKYDDMCLWAGEKTGRTRGRNWKLTLMNWVKRDSLKIKQDYAKQNNEVAL